ncbi:hypothetical protein B0H13DRAFT_1897467 [Mycena leptocephala]|nr:hypothetical protein B0H13DRAFT_1897467 [Mycena leptocephala]
MRQKRARTSVFLLVGVSPLSCDRVAALHVGRGHAKCGWFEASPGDERHREQGRYREGEQMVVGNKEYFKLRSAAQPLYVVWFSRLLLYFWTCRFFAASGGIEEKMADFAKEEADFGRFGHNPAQRVFAGIEPPNRICASSTVASDAAGRLVSFFVLPRERFSSDPQSLMLLGRRFPRILLRRMDVVAADVLEVRRRLLFISPPVTHRAPTCPYLLPFTDTGGHLNPIALTPKVGAEFSALDPSCPPSPAHLLQKTVTMDVHFMDVVTMNQRHTLEGMAASISFDFNLSLTFLASSRCSLNTGTSLLSLNNMHFKREISNTATMLPEAETMTSLGLELALDVYARNTFNNIGKGPRRWLLGGIVSVPYLLTPTMSEAEKAVKEREAKEAPQLNTTSHARKEAFLDTSTTACSFKSFPPQLNRTQPPKLPA